MKDNTQKRRFFVSPRPFVVAAILFALLTPNYLGVQKHWSLPQIANDIEVDAKRIKYEIIPKVVGDLGKNQMAKISESMMGSSNKLKEASREIAERGAIYHISGIISLVFTVLAFACKPRWVGILSLPFHHRRG